jgi:hypothetical protein
VFFNISYAYLDMLLVLSSDEPVYNIDLPTNEDKGDTLVAASCDGKVKFCSCSAEKCARSIGFLPSASRAVKLWTESS